MHLFTKNCFPVISLELRKSTSSALAVLVECIVDEDFAQGEAAVNMENCSRRKREDSIISINGFTHFNVAPL